MKANIAFLCLGALVCVSCGVQDANNAATAPARPRVGNEVPTLASFSDWKSIWDGKSWIVAHKTAVGKKPSVASLKANIVRSLLPDTLFSDAVAGDVANALSVEYLTSNYAFGKEDVAGFSVVKFNTIAPVWFSLFPALPWHEPTLGISSLPLANFMWRSLEKMPDVAWVEPNLQSELFAEYTFPPELKDGALPLKRIRADVAWEKVVDASGAPRYQYQGTTSTPLNWTNVAVIDTGVDYLHPDLHDNVYEQSHIFKNPRELPNLVDDDGNGYIDDIYGIDATVEMDAWNAQVRNSSRSGTPAQPVPGSADLGGGGSACPDGSEKCGHGTHVAGIIAAKPGPESSDDTIGPCPTCRILSVRVASVVITNGVESDGPIDDSSQIRAIDYIMNLRNESGDPYIRIVNMSLGKYFVSRSLSYSFRRLLENDILVVAAAGNDDTDTPNYPGAYSPVLSVCATSEPTASGGRGEFAKAAFSNFGAWVDICAPGVNILSTLPGGKSGALSGTSMATPYVAGAAGHLKSLFPTLSGAEIADRLMKYSNAVSLYHGVATTNTMNRLYEGWFPDDTQYFLLGTGMLDLGSAATEGKHCWSPEAKTPADCVSFAYANRNLGYLSQMNGGCVVSSVANSAHPVASAMASMPFVMLQVGALFSLMKRLRRRPKK